MENPTMGVYIPCASLDEAKKIASHLLKNRLIACANIFPITSMYHWENNVTEDQEYVIIVKTIESMYDNVQREVERNHSYNVPCIAKIPMQFNERYHEWLIKEIKG